MAIPKYSVTLRNLEARLRKFRDSLPEYLEGAVRSQEEAIIQAVAEDQLFRQGITGTGQKIMEYRPYTRRTIRLKQKKGQPTDRVTLRDTGKFHESMFLVYEPDGFYVTARDEKTKYLVKRYGGGIFRLTDQNLTRLIRNNIRTELERRIKEAAGK